MDNLDDFDLHEEDDSKQLKSSRLDIEWTTLNAIREMLGIALKGKIDPTYEQSLAFAKTLSPKIFDSDSSQIGKNREELLIVKEYRQRANAKSILENRGVDPVEIIDDEINDLEKLLRTEGNHSLIRRRLSILENVRKLLLPKKYTENQLIIRDLFKAKRNIPAPPIEGDTFREFRLTEDRGLRIRLLHPDPPEHAIGADLIYETYWDRKKLVRLALAQYKIWNGRTLYSSQNENLESQLAKLKNTFCSTGLCDHPDSERADAYRLPFCAVFLRPTDQLQKPDSRLISSGLHLPVCVAMRSWEETGYGGRKIERKKIRSEALSHRVFEEVFNTNMLGSKWLTYSEVEKLYQTHKILDYNEKIVVHTQEFGL